MEYQDLRDWIQIAEEMGELKTLKGCDWNLEIGAITEIVAHKEDGPAVLAEGRYAQAVRDEEKAWVARGINSVPAVVVENKWLISGGQPAEVFEQALRQMAAEARSQAG